MEKRINMNKQEPQKQAEVGDNMLINVDWTEADQIIFSNCVVQGSPRG